MYRLTVEHHLDEGYIARFAPDAISRVEGIQNVISPIFRKLFNLSITSSVSTYRSTADICKGTVTIHNLSGACNHHPSHNLTAWGLTNAFWNEKGYGTNKLAKFLWTGHALPPPITGGRWGIPYYTTFVNPQTDLTNSRYEIFHEMAHELEAPNHYCYEGMPLGGCSRTTDCYQCYDPDFICPVMTEYTDIEATPNDKLFCEPCINKIKLHLADHH